MEGSAVWEIQSQLSLSLSLHSVPQHENCPCPQDEVQTQDLCLLDMWTGPPPSFLVRAMLPRTEPRLGQVSQSSTTKTVERGGGGGPLCNAGAVCGSLRTALGQKELTGGAGFKSLPHFSRNTLPPTTDTHTHKKSYVPWRNRKRLTDTESCWWRRGGGTVRKAKGWRGADWLLWSSPGARSPAQGRSQ